MKFYIFSLMFFMVTANGMWAFSPWYESVKLVVLEPAMLINSKLRAQWRIVEQSKVHYCYMLSYSSESNNVHTFCKQIN